MPPEGEEGFALGVAEDGGSDGGASDETLGEGVLDWLGAEFVGV